MHNGIIENYASLRARLAAKGHTFQSQTDSEVLIHLIGELYKAPAESIAQARAAIASGSSGN